MHEVDRLAAIVQELLVLSRAGEHELPAERIELADAVIAPRSAGRKAADAKGLRIARRSDSPGATTFLREPRPRPRSRCPGGERGGLLTGGR